jgi:hypothetical protein
LSPRRVAAVERRADDVDPAFGGFRVAAERRKFGRHYLRLWEGAECGGLGSLLRTITA